MSAHTLGETPGQFARWEPIEFVFPGPDSEEQATPNPFTDYSLEVEFRCGDDTRTIRGFYAADGKAGQTGADSGDRWKVRFAAEQVGKWTYQARFYEGKDVALGRHEGKHNELTQYAAQGEFVVGPTATESNHDFRKRGFVESKNGYFRFRPSGEVWLKGGCDSPENLLAFEDFDGTYRIATESRDGEAAVPTEIHAYKPHVRDWQKGDPTWRGDKGKGLIGGLNYLASQGVNSVYFLTLNIGGDGNDVWPYAEPDSFERFDCSKLEQWNLVFNHMQRLGIALQVVTQETENERLLDDGDTGRLRSLYYQELIARFAHHPALVWNLGEENGPADFSPHGQNAEQQISMSAFFDKHDPYRHPVVIHTHSTAKGKEHILPDLLGKETLDGLSLQVDQPDRVHRELAEWRERSRESGHLWLISMDEIGKWDTGVVPDSVDADHDDLRRKVLWGALMSGAAGVEWYFGAKQPHNDLNCEDWRQRESMWQQTTIARKFFEEQVPIGKMETHDELCSNDSAYCFAELETHYVVYLPAGETTELELHPQVTRSGFDVRWFDPRTGSFAEEARQTNQEQPAQDKLLLEPADQSRDWVVLVRVNAN